jgi:hypothetical protein
MNDIFAQVFAKIGPATANTDHDALPVFTDSADKELGRRCLAAMMQMIQFHVAIFSLVSV